MMTDITILVTTALFVVQCVLWLNGKQDRWPQPVLLAWAGVSLAHLMLGIEIQAPVSTEWVDMAKQVCAYVLGGMLITFAGWQAYIFISRRRAGLGAGSA